MLPHAKDRLRGEAGHQLQAEARRRGHRHGHGAEGEDNRGHRQRTGQGAGVAKVHTGTDRQQEPAGGAGRQGWRGQGGRRGCAGGDPRERVQPAEHALHR